MLLPWDGTEDGNDIPPCFFAFLSQRWTITGHNYYKSLLVLGENFLVALTRFWDTVLATGAIAQGCWCIAAR